MNAAISPIRTNTAVTTVDTLTVRGAFGSDTVVVFFAIWLLLLIMDNRLAPLRLFGTCRYKPAAVILRKPRAIALPSTIV